MIGSYVLARCQARKPPGHRQTFVTMKLEPCPMGSAIFWTADQARNLAERLSRAADEADKEDGCEPKTAPIRTIH